MKVNERKIDESLYRKQEKDLDMTDSMRRHMKFRKGKDPEQFD